MRKVFLFILFIWQHAAAQEIVLSGNLKLPRQVSKVFVRYENCAEVIYDSALVKNQRFILKLPAKEPGRMMLTVHYAETASEDAGVFEGAAASKGTSASEKTSAPTKTSAPKETLVLFGVPGNLVFTARGTLKNYTLSATEVDRDYRIFDSMEAPYLQKLREYYAAMRASTSRKHQDSIKKLYIAVAAGEQQQVFAAYVKKYPSSPVSLYALHRYIGYGEFDPDTAMKYYEMLSPTVRQVPSATKLKDRINKGALTKVGSRAPDFTQNDTLGNPVKLSSLRGKYVLIDFWASWCGPCRAENPNVVKAFQQYKDKGFTVLGVSLDQPNGKEKWLKAIHNDGLTWTHVSDLKYWSNEVAALYDIRSIPQNLLLDPQGIIVARNLRGEDLNKKLAEILNR